MRRQLTPTLLPALLLALALVASACGSGVVDGGPLTPDTTPTTPEGADDDPDADGPTAPDEDPSDPADDTASDPDGDPGTDPEAEDPTTAVRLYYLAPGGSNPARADPFLISVERELPSEPRIALATLRALVDGPSDDEVALIDGVSSAVPGATLVLDVTIEDRIATVDLSREFESGGGSLSMLARLAQVVYTVTQFPTVDSVTFALDGQEITVFSGEGIVLDAPVTREDYHDLLPGVFVDVPAAGAEVRSPLELTGQAVVFEATFNYRVETDTGEVLTEGFAMTDSGIGWGRFDVTIDVEVTEPRDVRLVVWEDSAEDGSVQSQRVTPLRLLP